MALKQYLAVAAGQYDNRVIAAGEVFAAEFRGLKRDAAGAVVRDADGESVLVAIPDPAWVRRVGGAGPDADGAVDYEAMTLAELRAVAAAKGVDTTGLKGKAEVLGVVLGGGVEA